MASSSASPSALPLRGSTYAAPVPKSSQPAGTFLSGTKVQVGDQRVVIDRYLSEGGFAHVYVVRVPREGGKHELAVLKRVAVPDRDHLASMRTEVETMKKLKGHKHVVTYMDSHASQLKGGGYEVFLLMEFCGGGGLIDFMNTRLQHRLTEPEILKIFGDVAEGLATMHYLKPPLLHRDLKVENVLISKSASGNPMYKLCDFGSAAVPRPAAKTTEEGRLIEEDVQKHTTMQYRSPEMIDVWRKQPIDEKADIWALGVFLYKLCYYTTPFEDVGQMAILNASYKFPSYPLFSERLKNLIGSMLKEDPKQRPNIYQVIKEVCSMRGTDVPIKDIYTHRTQSEARRNESLPSPEPPMSSATIGLQKTARQVHVQSIPDIAPMRRGRPTGPAPQASVQVKPNASPSKGDPFAALDSKNYDIRSGAVDELSKRFPSLDEFSIVHEQSGNFPFESKAPVRAAAEPANDAHQRVAEALADEAFGRRSSKSQVPTAQLNPRIQLSASSNMKSNVASKTHETAQQSAHMHRSVSAKPVAYVSTGTGASPPSSAVSSVKMPELSQRPVWHVPEHHRSSSQPRASVQVQRDAAFLQPSLRPSENPVLLDIHRSKSQTATSIAKKSPVSSRPSLEGRRPSELELAEPQINRARSAHNRSRPTSMYVSSNLDYLRDQETSRKRPSADGKWPSRQGSQEREVATEDAPIDDDMEYLRNNEESDITRNRSHRKALGHHIKRSSLGSLSGTKQMLAGRFGDALKRFESQPTDGKLSDGPDLTTSDAFDGDDERKLESSPIGDFEAPPSGHAKDVDSAIDETEDLPPDVRRELERGRLSMEEKRIAEAAAEYRAKVAAQGTGGAIHNSKASTIQKRVQSLLDEGRQSPIQKRTAEGYGKYTDPGELPEAQQTRASSKAVDAPPAVRTTVSSAKNPQIPNLNTRQQYMANPPRDMLPHPPASAPPSAQHTAIQPRIISRPNVPPKSAALRTGNTGGSTKRTTPHQLLSGPERSLPSRPTDVSVRPGSSGLAALLAKDLEGVPDYPAPGSSLSSIQQEQQSLPPRSSSRRAPGGLGVGPASTVTAASDPEEGDLEAEFSRRYPSLAGIEMVETEISRSVSGEKGRKMKVREL